MFERHPRLGVDGGEFVERFARGVLIGFKPFDGDDAIDDRSRRAATAAAAGSAAPASRLAIDDVNFQTDTGAKRILLGQRRGDEGIVLSDLQAVVQLPNSALSAFRPLEDA